jgi:uncharacterized protein (TIGR02466 family)
MVKQKKHKKLKNKIMKNRIHYLFPIPLYESKIAITEKVLNFIENTKYVRMFLENGFYTENKYVLEDENLKELKNNIMEKVNDFVYNILKISKKQKFNLENSWINKHMINDWAQEHSHSNSILSGVYYIKTNENSGNICFHKDKNYINLFYPSINFSYEEENHINCSSLQFQPKEGTLLIFPSHLSHSVLTNINTNIRYSLAFNLFVKGKFGELETSLELK